MSFAKVTLLEKPKRPVLVAMVSLLGVLLAMTFAEAEEAEGVIHVRPVVEVDGKKADITLGDLIVATGVSRSALDTLKDVRLADIPQPGESRFFTAMGIEQVFRPYLRKIENQNGERISLRVPARVTVVRKSFRLNEHDVIEHITARLKEICSDCEFEITNLSLPVVPPNIPSDSTWTLQMRGEVPKGSFSFPLIVNHEAGNKRTYWVSGVLSVRRKVPVASRALQAGERLHPEDFIIQMKDITFSTDVAASEQDLLSSVMARPIGAGQIIWRGALRRDVAVKMGDVVKVTTGSDGWQVTIDGIAQGSAYIGDTLKVKIPRTQKVISGIVAEKGVVEVR